MATGGVLASAAGYAYAGAGASAEDVSAGSGGIASGNTVQIPVDVPGNFCGNTFNVLGLLNPAHGNRCVEVGHKGHGERGDHGGDRGWEEGSRATGTAEDSPGFLSGNTVQVPIYAPGNVCGNSVNVVGLGNKATDNTCISHHEQGHHTTPPTHHRPKPHCGCHHTPEREAPKPQHSSKPVHHTTPATVGHHAQQALAETGAGDVATAAAVAGGLILGGAVLYRRSRVTAGR